MNCFFRQNHSLRIHFLAIYNKCIEVHSRFMATATDSYGLLAFAVYGVIGIPSVKKRWNPFAIQLISCFKQLLNCSAIEG